MRLLPYSWSYLPLMCLGLGGLGVADAQAEPASLVSANRQMPIANPNLCSYSGIRNLAWTRPPIPALGRDTPVRAATCQALPGAVPEKAGTRPLAVTSGAGQLVRFPSRRFPVLSP